MNTIEVQLNGDTRTLSAEEGAPTVASMIHELGLGDRRVAVEVNGDVVPRAEHANHALAAGDTIEVVTFVGGG